MELGMTIPLGEMVHSDPKWQFIFLCPPASLLQPPCSKDLETLSFYTSRKQGF